MNFERRHHRGFSLIELLVALVVFAALAAAAYGGLDQIARTRAALAAQQDRFAAITRAVSVFERDLQQAIDRPVIGNNGAPLPALIGSPGNKLQRGRYAVLDRAPNSAPAARLLIDRVTELHLRYFDGTSYAWVDAWPLPGSAVSLPRAVEFRIMFADLGEIRRVVELPSSFPVASRSAP